MMMMIYVDAKLMLMSINDFVVCIRIVLCGRTLGTGHGSNRCLYGLVFRLEPFRKFQKLPSETVKIKSIYNLHLNKSNFP